MFHVGPDGMVQFRFDHKSRDTVYLVGDFNQWDDTCAPMENRYDKWFLALKLNPGEYQFKYKTGKLWYNDQYAEKYVKGISGGKISVVTVDSD